MDIHRCRFVPFQPQSINAVAFSHDSDTKKKSPRDLRLAIGRSNGDIEIWNPQGGKWLQETIFRGKKDTSIEGLVWTRETFAEEDVQVGQGRDGLLRLFSINNSASLTEWDLSLGTPKRQSNGNFGELWCIAAQARKQKSEDGSSEGASSQLIAAGCSDGVIVLFSTEDNELRFDRSLAKPPVKSSKVLSITWKDEYTVVAGYDNSTIRVHDIRNKATLRTMSLGKPVEGNETFVWCLKCLPDGTIISGDSSGELKIWDPVNYSLMQRLKTHQSHIMDITANAAGDMIASVGVDRRTVYYQPVAKDGKKAQRWTQSMHRRFHHHDIKAVAAYESKTASVIVSGGVDTIPVVAPLRQWQHEHHRALPHLPQKQQMSSTRERRFVLTWWEHEVCIWHLPHKDHATEAQERDHDLIARLAIKDEESIKCAKISSDGRFVLLSTSASTKLFQLRTSRRNGALAIHTRRVDLPSALSNAGARSVSFSPNGQWLCVVRLNNVICLAKLQYSTSSSDKPVVLDKVVKLHRKPRQGSQTQSALGDYRQAINCVSFSADGRILACGDLSGAVDAWILEGHEDLNDGVASSKTAQDGELSDDSSDNDSDEDENDMGDNKTIIHGQRWERNPNGSNLPRLSSAIIALTFRASMVLSKEPNEALGLHATRHTPHPIAQEMPSSDDRLVVITANHEIIEIDVLKCRLSDWSRRNPASLLPRDFTIQKDRAMGILEDPRAHERLWIYGPTWLFMLDMSQDLHIVYRKGHIGDYDLLELVTNSQKKRKRKVENMERKAKRNTGAGDEMPLHESHAGVGKYGHKFESGADAERQVFSIARLPSPASDDDMEIPSRSSALAAMRRKEIDQRDESLHNGDAFKVNGNDAKVKSGSEEPATKKERPREPWWITMEYRYVFGMATLGSGEDGGDDDSTKGMEVVIIERPMWDVDLPPRFDGGQDWDT
jgi:U3 small nucleolar RNA-associated protein 4